MTVGVGGDGLRAQQTQVFRARQSRQLEKNLFPQGLSILFFFVCVCLFFAFSRAASAAYGDSQVRGGIGAVAASLRQSHSNTGSELHLQPTPQLTATLDP